MLQVAPLAEPRENAYALLASLARRLRYSELSGIAVVSGIVALGATAAGRASWMLLAVCYVAWCFAGWGILFRSAAALRSGAWRALQLTIVVSSTFVFGALVVGTFFWALGPSWVL